MNEMMQQIQKEQAPAQRMPMQDILRQDAERAGADFNKVYTAIAQGVQAGNMRIMRSGNSLLIYKIMQPGVAEVHISTADTPQMMVKAVKEFDQALRKSGFNKAVSTTDNPQIGRVLQASGVPVQVSMKPTPDGRQEYQLVFGG